MTSQSVDQQPTNCNHQIAFSIPADVTLITRHWDPAAQAQTPKLKHVASIQITRNDHETIRDPGEMELTGSEGLSCLLGMPLLGQ